MTVKLAPSLTDGVDFGDIPPAVDAILQRGVAAHRTDRKKAAACFGDALIAAPDCLPAYFCLYKVLAYSGQLDDAHSVAERGLAEAAFQAALPADWRGWGRSMFTGDLTPASRFALYTLKALAFIALKADDLPRADALLAQLRALDPSDSVGWRVTDALAEGVR